MQWRSNLLSKISSLDGCHDHHYSRTLDVNFLFILSSNLGIGVVYGRLAMAFGCFLFFCFYDYTRRWVLGVGDNQVTRPWMDVFIAFVVFYT